jgi:transposase
VICILNEHGSVVDQVRIRGHWPKLLEYLRQLEEPFQICFEASCGYGHLYDRLRTLAKRVVVAHPGLLRLIFRSKRKNDRVDAAKLAKLLYLDEVPPVHVPSVDVRAWRQLIEFRHRTVAKRTRTKNTLRTLLRSHGIMMPARQKLWTSKGIAWLTDVELPTRQSKLQRDLLLDELDWCQRRLKRIEDELSAIADRHPAVAVLRTIPGVGIRTAEATVAYLDDPRRFSHNRAVGSYVGLVPSQDQSAGVNRLGRITRQGPATVRKLLVEAAWQGIRRSPRLQQRFEAYQRNDPKRKKIALVATAHYLVRSMHAMLLTGEAWREAA